MINVCPSTNPCTEDKLIDYVKELQKLGIEILHCDVMDGKFVKEQCLSINKLKEISNNTLMQLDVHLMVKDPMSIIMMSEYLNIAYITVHFEAFENKDDLLSVIDEIHKNGKLAGLSVKPDTPISAIYNYLPLIDLVLVMSVEPGRSGQKFMPKVLSKVNNLLIIRQNNKFNYKVEIDGGINTENIQDVVNAGCDMVVIGSALYNAPNRKCFIKTIQLTEKSGSNLKKLFPNYKGTKIGEIEKDKKRILCENK